MRGAVVLAAILACAGCGTDTLERLQDCSITGCGKKKIDYIEDGVDCTVCSDCAGERGHCEVAGTACDRGFLDRDELPENGCEAQLSRLDAYWRAKTVGPTSATLSINGHLVYPGAFVDTVVIDPVPECQGPNCYALRNLQLSFDAFPFDKVNWTKGVVIINGPVWNFQLGAEVGMRVPFVMSFEVTQDSESKLVVSSGYADVTLNPLEAGGGTIQLGGQVEFGGYLFDQIVVSSGLARY